MTSKRFSNAIEQQQNDISKLMKLGWVKLITYYLKMVKIFHISEHYKPEPLQIDREQRQLILMRLVFKLGKRWRRLTGQRTDLRYSKS